MMKGLLTQSSRPHTRLAKFLECVRLQGKQLIGRSSTADN